MASGDWSHLPWIPHINVLEFKAVLLCLRAFLHRTRGKSILLLTDNVSVAAYINRQGGTHSPQLCDLATQLWRWCRAHDIEPRATYLPGEENLVADFLSRGKCLPSEWSLNQLVFESVNEKWGPLEIDLFASSFNHRLPAYCSRVVDRKAVARDALSLHWGRWSAYAFPPFALIPLVLRKVAEDEASLVLIAPHWPGRSWFPLLLALLVDEPWLLPQRRVLVAQPISGLLHAQLDRLRLSARRLCGTRQRGWGSPPE